MLAVSATNHGSNPGGWFSDPAQSGGGAVTDHSPHVVDLMRWMFESEVTHVFAEVSQELFRGEVEDCAVLTFQFQNGVCVTLDPSWSRPIGHPFPVDVTLEVVGSAGLARLDAFANHIAIYKANAPRQSSYRVVRLGDDMDLAMVREFVGSVGSHRPGPTIASGVDGLRAVQVTEAAYESMRQHRPVEIGRGSGN